MTRQNRQPQINDKKANYSVYLDSTSGTIFYELYGCWDTAHIELLWEIEIPKVDGVETGQSYKKAILNCAKLETIDTAGALLIHNLLEEMKTLHIKSQFASSSKEIRETLKLIEHFYHPIPYKKELGTGFSACLI